MAGILPFSGPQWLCDIARRVDHLLQDPRVHRIFRVMVRLDARKARLRGEGRDWAHLERVNGFLRTRLSLPEQYLCMAAVHDVAGADAPAFLPRGSAHLLACPLDEKDRHLAPDNGWPAVSNREQQEANTKVAWHCVKIRRDVEGLDDDDKAVVEGILAAVERDLDARLGAQRAVAGTETAEVDHPSGDAPRDYCFRKKGDMWEVRFGGKEGYYPDQKGFGYIAKLIASPHPLEPIEALVLAGGYERLLAVNNSEQPTLDRPAMIEYRQRIQELDADIKEAKQSGDHLSQEKLTEEREKLQQEFNRSMGLRGKAKALKPDTPAQTARTSARKALDRAYDLMRPVLPRLIEHLDGYIQAEGTAYAYRPTETFLWVLD